MCYFRPINMGQWDDDQEKTEKEKCTAKSKQCVKKGTRRSHYQICKTKTKDQGELMKESGFESMEKDNGRSPMVSHQSKDTPESVAHDYKVVFDMKSEGHDEAYGLAGKRGVQGDFAKINSQAREYHWS